MKFLRLGEPGSEIPCLLDNNDNIRDISDHISDLSGDSLSELDKFKNIDIISLPILKQEKRIGPCVGNVGKLVGIGFNFSDHAAEYGVEVPTEPVVFLKANSSICGPNDPIIIPRGSEKTDWEVELGIVISKKAKYIDETDAHAHIAGYCVVNDVSERTFQLEMSGQWTKGKSCDNFGPIGPWLVTPDEVPDPQNLSMWLTVNGESRQQGSTTTMIFGVNFIVAYLSQFMTLYPGDVISTGTPPGVGVGMKPPKFLRAGDVVELGIEGLGIQRQHVIKDN